MRAAGAVLAAWLGPAIWLAVPTLLVAHGTGGLWPGLLIVVAPLLALTLRARPAADDTVAVPLVHVATHFLMVALLIWAGLVLVGDLASRLGVPRWHGIALAAAGGLLLTAWRGAERVVPLLLLVAGVSVLISLVALSATTGLSPLGAWRAVSERPAFVFPAASRWVTEGRDLRLAQGQQPLRFDEAHRVTAAAETTLRTRIREGRQTLDREVPLAAGQSFTLRPGDQLEPTAGARVKFEAGRRVPGAPATGLAWGDGGSQGLVATLVSVGLGMTLLGAGVALFGPPLADPAPRGEIVLVGAGLLATFGALQAWAVYAVLAAPEIFMGGITPDRLIDVPGLALGARPTGMRLQLVLVIAVGASFMASTVALRARLAAVDPAGDGEIGSDLGLWTMVFVVAALASLWHVDPWALSLTALGAGAAVFLPRALLPDAAARREAATVAGVVALAVYGVLLLFGRVAGLARPAGSLLGAFCEQPALLAVPAGLGALWLATRGGRRTR
jgi:hypothetical protein